MAGDSKVLENGKDEDYVTVMRFVLPLDEEEFVPETYSVTSAAWDSPIEIKLYQIEDASEDQIFQWGKMFSLGANMQLQNLPFSIFSDNRGKYPCFFAQIVFPFRLNDWRNPSQEKIEQKNLTGIYSKDKLLALEILNKLFASEKYSKDVRLLEYEDVTNFVETYFLKGHSQAHLYQHLILLDSRNAFEEGIEEFLGDDLWNHVSGFVRKKEGEDINTEADLHEIVMEVIIDIIKHQIENRNWIQAFWNDPHKTKIKGKMISIPKQPKREPSIQPTLQVLLCISLNPLGVHVERETAEGVGSLDFKCLFTTKDGTPLCVLVEFKLAHGDIKHGLEKQLPAYLTANKSNHGIYLIMWFKDEEGRVFKKPQGRTKMEVIAQLNQIAESIYQEKGFIITTEMIDASVRPSASKL
ncbi:hypothetical protein [Candidatus Nitrospira allomarina]|uniref:PD-(D/E)XK nuclease superfamily protein n=1 Tax=Candidatus Nitrospira allomarina TaxID=3020900 RepID=A0AA96JTY4_9BACT|nr:hypothetical protein [Candidatus Nitrospira allomarina]WNM59952.1 hypothetical protein PP769_09395 [Candidatus Nitrospira allomarina]